MASFFRSSAPQAGAPQTDAYGNPIGQRPSAPASGAGSYSRLPPPPTPPRQQEPPASNYSRPSQPLQRGRSPIPPPRNAYGDEKSAHRPSGVGVRGVFRVEKGTETTAFFNCLIANPADLEGVQCVRVKRSHYVGVKCDPSVPQGVVLASNPQRQWLNVSVGEGVEVESVDLGGRGAWLGEVDIEVGFAARSTEDPETFSADEIAKHLISRYSGLPLSLSQPLVFDFRGRSLKALVRTLAVLDLSLSSDQDATKNVSVGILTESTDITVRKDEGSRIKIKASGKKPPPNAILQPNFKFEDMGIGGLDSEFSAIFRRAFASRIFPPSLVEKLGIQHVKGLLLFGPPGTGKTLMARQIGKMLNAREPKIVNGPEILNKFVGASEENIRKLFEDAEKEYKAKGDESGLHIIIFDELDAICKQRGSTGGGTGVGDSVVNQLLSKMDGVDQLNNILIIGMTNRLDMIDEALLRPGRLEVHMEISLPDEHGRLQILNIHTTKMKLNNVLGADVDIKELAAVTKNFSGAEIGGLIKSATSFAMNRHIKVGTVAGISNDLDAMQVMRGDFMLALDEVHAAFGVSESELQQVVQNGIIHYDPRVDATLKDGSLYVEQVRKSQRTPLVSLLIHGPAASGKTALAATIALASDFPFIKLVSPENMVGFREDQKVAYLNKVFNDSYKSPLSVVVVDNIERILDWVPIGPRFSNNVLQALLVLISKRPPKGNRLLIICTTSNRPMLADMELSEAFDASIRVPSIATLAGVTHVLREVDFFQSQIDERRLLEQLELAGLGKKGLNVGVKKLLGLVEMARQDREPVNTFVKNLMEYLG